MIKCWKMLIEMPCFFSSMTWYWNPTSCSPKFTDSSDSVYQHWRNPYDLDLWNGRHDTASTEQLFEPAHAIMAVFVLSEPSSNAHAQPSSGARCQVFGRTLCLRPYFMCANSEGSGEAARMCRLAWAFAVRLCDKYHILMSWLIYFLLFARRQCKINDKRNFQCFLIVTSAIRSH